MGTDTAAASSVEVSSHSVLVIELRTSAAMLGKTGISSDWFSEAIRPATETTASAAIWFGCQPPGSSG
jgi:hypothetical protein